MLPLGPLFAGVGLYVCSRIYDKHNRIFVLILLSVVFSLLYAWLDGIMLGLSPEQFMATAALSIPPSIVTLFFLDRYEDSLSTWLGIYVLAVAFYIFLL